MRRPPRRPDEPLFGPRQIGMAVLQGIGVMAASFGIYAWLLSHPAAGELEARGGGYVALVVGVLVLALTDSARSGRLFAPHRRIFWAIAAAIAAVLAVMFAAPPVSSIFDVAPPTPEHLVLALLAGAVGGGWTALGRLPHRRATAVSNPRSSPQRGGAGKTAFGE